MKASSEAIPVRRMGRVWTTSASSEPSVTTRVTPSASAASRTVVQKARHRNEGSAPATKTRS